MERQLRSALKWDYIFQEPRIQSRIQRDLEKRVRALHRAKTDRELKEFLLMAFNERAKIDEAAILLVSYAVETIILS